MSTKVLIASEYFYPHWTGIAQSIFFFSQQLVKRGDSVTVLTTQFDTALLKQETYQHLHIIRTPFAVKISRTHYSPVALMDFIKLCRHTDMIIINSPHSNIIFFSIIAKVLGKKLIIFHQGDLTLPKKTGKYIVNRLIEKVFDVATLISFTLSDTISTHTKDYAQNSRVMKYFLHKFKTYIPPISLSQKKPTADFKNKLDNLKKDHVLIGFAGRFVEEKGFDILLAALPNVIEKIPNAMFVFAGETAISYEPFFQLHKNEIEKHKKHLVFLGRLNEGNLAAFYQHLDVFVLSSRSDCFALTQIEAMLSGVPVVATDIPGARVAVQKTGFGEIAKSEDPHDLAEKIINVVEKRKAYDKYADKIYSLLAAYSTLPID